jgi:hypothetical protein
MTTIIPNTKRRNGTIDAVVDTGGGRLVLVLPLTELASMYAMEELPAGSRFLGVYLLEDDQAERTIRKMMELGLNLKIDGACLPAH